MVFQEGLKRSLIFALCFCLFFIFSALNAKTLFQQISLLAFGDSPTLPVSAFPLQFRVFSGHSSNREREHNSYPLLFEELDLRPASDDSFLLASSFRLILR
jgi:hypothetical protein